MCKQLPKHFHCMYVHVYTCLYLQSLSSNMKRWNLDLLAFESLLLIAGEVWGSFAIHSTNIYLTFMY